MKRAPKRPKRWQQHPKEAKRAAAELRVEKQRTLLARVISYLMVHHELHEVRIAKENYSSPLPDLGVVVEEDGTVVIALGD